MMNVLEIYKKFYEEMESGNIKLMYGQEEVEIPEQPDSMDTDNWGDWFKYEICCEDKTTFIIPKAFKDWLKTITEQGSTNLRCDELGHFLSEVANLKFLTKEDTYLISADEDHNYYEWYEPLSEVYYAFLLDINPFLKEGYECPFTITKSKN